MEDWELDRLLTQKEDKDRANLELESRLNKLDEVCSAGLVESPKGGRCPKCTRKMKFSRTYGGSYGSFYWRSYWVCTCGYEWSKKEDYNPQEVGCLLLVFLLGLLIPLVVGSVKLLEVV